MRHTLVALLTLGQLLACAPGAAPAPAPAAPPPTAPQVAGAGPATTNPYLARPGEAAVSLRVATCAVSGGFVQLYTGLDNGIFTQYGLAVEHVNVLGGNASLAAMSTNDVQLLY